jgi:hypothetical protein
MFYVNYSDPAFPRVERCADTAEYGTSFHKAKAELIETIESHLSHWRTQMRDARKLTKQQVAQDETIHDTTERTTAQPARRVPVVR